MYTYSKLLDEANYLMRSGVETGAIGSSEDGRMIPYIFVGKHNAPSVIITGAIHAREHIAAYVVMRQAVHAVNRFPSGLNGGIYFIPMLNPDGNEIIVKGISAVRRRDKNLICRILSGKNRGLYKANANGVDLNVNFDAGFGTGKQNVFEPDIENYVGQKPFSESETRAIRDFTLLTRPAATVSYHAIGREIYYEYGQTGAALARDKKIAERLNERLMYKLVGDDGTSAGGYKDWCIQHLKIPAFTVELVSDEHAHPFLDYARAEEDMERNIDLPIRLLEMLNESGGNSKEGIC